MISRVAIDAFMTRATRLIAIVGLVGLLAMAFAVDAEALSHADFVFPGLLPFFWNGLPVCALSGSLGALRSPDH
jgi:hypothetical protein